jgi:hypothetical protein
MYHKASVLARDVAWFRAQRYVVYELDASAWSTPERFHADVERVLELPTRYARNLAGWLDALADLPVPDDSGVILQFRRFDRFAAAQRPLAQSVLDSIEATSRRLMLTGRRLIALVQSDDPRIRFERVGAVPVTWNPAEWTDEQRGLRGAPD